MTPDHSLYIIFAAYLR